MTSAFKKTTLETQTAYTLYGKLPNRADFVRDNANHPVMVEFDQMLQRAFESLSSTSDWIELYDRTNPVEFQYVSSDLRYTLMGVLAPSQDQSGRRYPLVAGTILPSDLITGYAHVAPIANEVFFDGLREQVSNAIDNSVEALSCRQFLESHLHTSEAVDLDLAKSVVTKFMRSSSTTFLNGLLAGSTHATSLEQAILNIAFYRAFLQRFDRAATNQIILLPLPQEKGELPLIASTWLSILDSIWQGADQSRRWNGNYLILQNPITGCMMLATYLGKTPASFAPLMLGKILTEPAVLDLCNELDVWKSHAMYAEISYALNRTLTVPTLSLSELCAFLQDIGAKLGRVDI